MSKFFIGRPIVAIVISIITVIAGLVGIAKLPVAQLPDIVPPQINGPAGPPGSDGMLSSRAATRAGGRSCAVARGPVGSGFARRALGSSRRG